MIGEFPVLGDELQLAKARLRCGPLRDIPVSKARPGHNPIRNDPVDGLLIGQVPIPHGLIAKSQIREFPAHHAPVEKVPVSHRLSIGPAEVRGNRRLVLSGSPDSR